MREFFEDLGYNLKAFFLTFVLALLLVLCLIVVQSVIFILTCYFLGYGNFLFSIILFVVGIGIQIFVISLTADVWKNWY